MDHSPHELLTRAQQGDQEAFEALYGLYFTPVFRYLLLRTKNKKDAEDIAQTVFVKLATANAMYQERSSAPLAYLFTIARNALIDWRRKESHGIVYDDEELTTTLEHSRAYASDETTGREERDLVARALVLLDDVARQVVELRFIQGYSGREIAKAIGKSEDAVRQIQSRAFKKLRKTLKEPFL